jgi:hypothetical protein
VCFPSQAIDLNDVTGEKWEDLVQLKRFNGGLVARKAGVRDQRSWVTGRGSGAG